MAEAKRIICVGHAALDRIYRIEAFPAQPTKVRALEYMETGGGMAANAAVAIARLGGKAELWSRVGDDSAGNTIRAGLKAEHVDVRCVQSFEGARSSTSAIIVDDRGERLIVGQRDAGMPSDTSWLPLERVKEADVVLGDLRWLEGVRTVFAHARKDNVPTVLDADLGAREALSGLLNVTDYAIFSAPALREFAAGSDDAERLNHILSFGVKHAGVTLGSEGYAWRERGKRRTHSGFQRERHRYDRCWRCVPRCLRVDAGRGPFGRRACTHGRCHGCAQVHAARFTRRSALAFRTGGIPI